MSLTPGAIGKAHVVGNADKVLQAARGVLAGVEGLDQRLAGPAPFLVHIGRVRFLDVRRIEQHDRAQVARGRRAQDHAPEAALDQRGNVARVINVRVRQDQDVDLGSVKGQVAVALKGLRAAALVQAAVHQDARPVHGHHVHRAGSGLRGAKKLYLHENSLPLCPPKRAARVC